MASVKVRIDEHGGIAQEGIHDATVQGLNYQLGKRLEICLRDVSNNDRWLLLEGLIRIKFQDVVEGTIVSDVFCWQLNKFGREPAPPEAAWRVLLGGNCIEADFPAVVSNIIERYSEFYLVLIESSYGGSIAAIANRVNWRSNMPTPRSRPTDQP